MSCISVCARTILSLVCLYINSCFVKVEYNPLTNFEKVAYVGQRLMYPIIKKIIPYHAGLKKKCQ